MRTFTRFTSIVFIGLLTLSTGANAGLILDLTKPCSTSTVTAGGDDADACLGLYDKDGNQEQATEAGLNQSSLVEYDLAEIDGWDDLGAFGRNNWVNIDNNETGGDGPFDWSIDPAISGDYLFAIKQSTFLGLWLFEDLFEVSGGTFDDILADQGGWSNYRIFYSDSVCEVDCGPPPDEIPEPSILFLLGSGLLVLGLRKKTG